MEPEAVAKLVGAVGLTGASVVVNVILWRAYTAAQEKLDTFQDARIKEQADLIRALSAKEHGP